MGLIDKDVLTEKLESNAWNIDEWELPHDQVSAGLEANAMDRETVKNMPTVDAVPVRHGKWLTPRGHENAKYCSECKSIHHKDNATLYTYCPNCGARMDEE